MLVKGIPNGFVMSLRGLRLGDLLSLFVYFSNRSLKGFHF